METMRYRFLIFLCVCSLSVGAASNPPNMKDFNSTARGVIYNSCMPVEIEEAKEKGEDDPTSLAYYICKVISGICSSTEKFAKNKKPCTKSLKKYDVALRNRGNSLLHQAAYYGRTDLAKVMIDIGVDLDMQQQGVGSTTSGKGWTPLMLASAEGHNDVVFDLIQAGADVNAKNELGRTALMFASIYGYYSIAKELLARGADPNILPNDNTGWTALIAAVNKGNVEIVKLLVEYGSHVNIKDREGKTALKQAEEQGNLDIVRILRQSSGNE